MASRAVPGGVSGPAKVRLDQLIVRRGLAESGARAQALILAGKIRAPGLRRLKPGEKVSPDQVLERIEDLPYVSRGGLKLEAALKGLAVDVRGRPCLDLGASTGGFTDCLLRHGAARVLALDVGRGQLHPALRKDPRVLSRERTHVARLERSEVEGFSGSGGPPLVTMDLSFISLGSVLPLLAGLLPEGSEVLALVKPQFECGPRSAPKGVVRDPAARAAAVEGAARSASSAGFEVLGRLESPVHGPKGNIETFIHLKRKAEA